MELFIEVEDKTFIIAHFSKAYKETKYKNFDRDKYFEVEKWHRQFFNNTSEADNIGAVN